MLKILNIVGARPQFIKASMIYHVINDGINHLLLHTGQHFDANMSTSFFVELNIPQPNINLGIHGGTHAEQTGNMLIGIENVLIDMKPDIVLVYGDTNSTLAGTLAAIKLGMPIAHIEAGLRSFNKNMPEENNRVVCDHLSDFLFCPTDNSMRNLNREGIKNGVHKVGDLMIDAIVHYLPTARQRSKIMDTLQLTPKNYSLLTVHRAGNTDNHKTLIEIFTAIGQLNTRMVFPIHPRTKNAINYFKLKIPPNIVMIEPVGYFDMLILEENAECIFTDSGGIQKEAYFLGTRCITLRDETEWLETVESGWNVIAGTEATKILGAYQLETPNDQNRDLYGSGNAGEKIINILTNEYIKA